MADDPAPGRPAFSMQLELREDGAARLSVPIDVPDVGRVRMCILPTGESDTGRRA